MIADVRSPAPYSIAEGKSTERIRVLVLEGELDLAAAPRLQARVAETVTGRALVLDFARVTFIDSAVLKELLRARRLLDLTRTSELFDSAATVDEAVRRLG
jgi:anti-anti-sigma regulatory factor